MNALCSRDQIPTTLEPRAQIELGGFQTGDRSSVRAGNERQMQMQEQELECAPMQVATWVSQHSARSVDGDRSKNRNSRNVPVHPKMTSRIQTPTKRPKQAATAPCVHVEALQRFHNANDIEIWRRLLSHQGRQMRSNRAGVATIPKTSIKEDAGMEDAAGPDLRDNFGVAS